MRFIQGVFLLSLGLLITFGACRRNQPSLVDRNQEPETVLWYAPADSTEYEYLVHLFWRGTDSDGTVEEFIWTIKDTLVTDEGLSEPGYRVVMNCNKGAGQTVFHIHLHFLAGRELRWPPG